MPLKQMVFCLPSKHFIYLLVLLGTIFCSCKEEKKEITDSTEELVMYEPSEMANLMNAFYTYNEALKSAIETGAALPVFPESFENIHTAAMTDADGRTPIFQSFTPIYLEAQKAILDSNDGASLKERYNKTINLCISCHRTECVGPIPRIKKLIIK